MKNTKSKSMKSKNSNNPQNMQHQSLINLINMITQARKNKTKSQTNLPARLMKMSNMQKPKSYEKSVSSSYSSIMHNGKKQIKGKQIINNSTKPFIQINEIQDGQIQHYMVPKNTIPYNKSINNTHIQTGMPSHMPMPMPRPMPIPFQMKIQSPKTSMNIYSTKIKKSKKTKTKKTKTKKTKTKKSKSKKSKSKKSKSKKSKSKKSKKTKSKK